MVLKTFNVDKEVYERYSKHCKKNGVSMSKKVDAFLRRELDRVMDMRGMELREDVIKGKISLDTKEFANEPNLDVHPLQKYC